MVLFGILFGPLAPDVGSIGDTDQAICRGQLEADDSDHDDLPRVDDNRSEDSRAYGSFR